jgi:hypothetical protein
MQFPPCVVTASCRDNHLALRGVYLTVVSFRTACSETSPRHQANEVVVVVDGHASSVYPSGRYELLLAQPDVPAMLAIPPGSLYTGAPYLVTSTGLRLSLGWQETKKLGSYLRSCTDRRAGLQHTRRSLASRAHPMAIAFINV